MTENEWAGKHASDCVREFHIAFGHPVADKPGIPEDKELVMLRERLIEEESREVIDACWQGNLANIAKELADLIYVIQGMALVYGIPLDEVFEAVHRSNMSKLDENGNVLYREDGKVLKGPNYEPPNIQEILDRATTREDQPQQGTEE